MRRMPFVNAILGLYWDTYGDIMEVYKKRCRNKMLRL